MRKARKYEDCHKIIDDINHKQCYICEQWKPCDSNNFYKSGKNKIDGFNPYCIVCTKAKSEKWRFENPERFKIQYDRKNKKQKHLERIRIYTKQQRESGYIRQYQKNNPEKIKSYMEERRNKTHIISSFEWDACRLYFNYRCTYCGLTWEDHFRMFNGKIQKIDLHKEHVEHDGLNDLSNCVPACMSCNSQKWKYPLNEWYNSKNQNFTVERMDKIQKWLLEDYKKYIINYDIKNT